MSIVWLLVKWGRGNSYQKWKWDALCGMTIMTKWEPYHGTEKIHDITIQRKEKAVVQVLLILRYLFT